MSDTETQASELEQLDVKEVQELSTTPPPIAIGNDKIEILKHGLTIRSSLSEYPPPPGLDLAIRNVCASTIATARFQVDFYDEAGNVVETAKHEEIALESETSRGVHIDYPLHQDGKIASYEVRITRTTTADVEKVQLRRHETETTEDGEEHITGLVKNISRVKTDAAVVATFFDLQDESIGTKVAVIRDIEPNTIRQYELKFRPQEGDIVKGYSLRIGELAE